MSDTATARAFRHARAETTSRLVQETGAIGLADALGLAHAVAVATGRNEPRCLSVFASGPDGALRNDAGREVEHAFVALVETYARHGARMIDASRQVRPAHGRYDAVEDGAVELHRRVRALASALDEFCAVHSIMEDA